MRRSFHIPEINAGSTADIAFLLLIFFLVTTTFPNDKGIVRKLPEPCLTEDCSKPIKERNLLQIALNKEGTLMINQKQYTMDSLVYIIKNFVDNNGDNSCTYCLGRHLIEYSEHPRKAVLSLVTDRESNYRDFMAVQNAITMAFYELRLEYAQQTFRKDMSMLTETEMQAIREAYPLFFTEAQWK